MRIRPTLTLKQDLAFSYLGDNETNEIQDLQAGYGGGYHTLPDSQPEANRWIQGNQ